MNRKIANLGISLKVKKTTLPLFVILGLAIVSPTAYSQANQKDAERGSSIVVTGANVMADLAVLGLGKKIIPKVIIDKKDEIRSQKTKEMASGLGTQV